MAPTTPYCTSDQVSYLLTTLFVGSTANANSMPTASRIDTLIPWTDSLVEATFRSVGYKIPFAVLSGETWPMSQTTFLSYMSAVGTAALAGGYILRPAPAMGGFASRAAQGNVFGELFDRMRRDILETGIGFRADYYKGTKAEKWLSEPYGPRIDFVEDYIDPTRFQGLAEYTEMLMDEYAEVRSLDIDWDYVYELRSSSVD